MTRVFLIALTLFILPIATLRAEDNPPAADEVLRAATQKAAPEKQNFNDLLNNLTPKNDPSYPRRADQNKFKPLMKQIAKCMKPKHSGWMMEVRLDMNPDRTVRKASIINKKAYANDKAFRDLADRFFGALEHSDCKYLKFPENEYSEWKSTMISIHEPAAGLEHPPR